MAGHWLTLVVVSALSAAPAAGQPGGAGMVRQARKLELNRPAERELGPGQADVFTIEMTAGQLAHVVAEQKAVDFIVTVLGPKGNELLTADSPNYELGPEPVTWVAEGAGTYTVKVSTSPRFFVSGRYQLELTKLGAALERDTMQAEAERLFRQAVERDQAGGKADLQEALRLYGEAASLRHKLPGSYEEALCLHRRGRILTDPETWQKALEVYQRALALWRAAGSRAGEAISLLNTGGIYNESAGQPRKGLEYCLQALEATRAAGCRSIQVYAPLNIGSVYLGMDDNQKALEAYQRALFLSRALGDRSVEARLLTDIGNVDCRLAENQKALEAYQQALSVGRAAGDRTNEASALIGIGNAYYRLAENQKALESYEQVLPISRAAGDRVSESSAMIGIANIHSRSGEDQKATGYYEQALSLARALSDRSTEGTALCGLVVAYYSSRRKAKGAGTRRAGVVP